MRRALSRFGAAALLAAASASAAEPPAKTPPPAQAPPAAERPVGVTVHSRPGPARPNRPVISVRPAAGGTATRTADRYVLTRPDGLPERTPVVPKLRAGMRTGAVRGTTIGPGAREQASRFTFAPESPGDPLDPATRWKPTPATEARHPLEPYPWNRTTFDRPVFDPTWRPTSAWAEGSGAEWSRVTWSRPSFDVTWKPRDAWGRRLQQTPAATPPPAPDGDLSGQPAQAEGAVAPAGPTATAPEPDEP